MHTSFAHGNTTRFRLAIAVLFYLLFSLHLLHAAKLTAIQEALDIGTSSVITVVEQRYIKYKTDENGFIEENTYGVPVTTTDSTAESQSKWVVQSSKDKGTSPYSGKSCIRSSISAELSPSYDALKVQLVCKVSGPGVFTFACKTSTTDASDGLVVYVDGEEVLPLVSGYYLEDFDFDTYITTYTALDWETQDIQIPGGKATGGRYEGTFDHEIIFEFYKDEPWYTYNDNDKLVYSSTDGPVKPDVKEYDGSSDPYYQEDLAAYKAQKAIFFNCIWLDDFRFEPLAPALGFFDDISETFTDEASFLLDTNAEEFGYYVKYTTNGSTPVASSKDYLVYDDIVNEEAIEVTECTTVKAKLFSNSKTPYSPAMMISAEVKIKASTPVIAIDNEKSTPSAIVVSMTTGYDGNIIHYTTDGSTPTSASPVYDPAKGLSVSKACTIKAIAMRNNVFDSDVGTLTISQANVPTITVKNQKGQSPTDFVYDANDKITVTMTPPDGFSVICKINDGAEQNYENAFTLNDPVSSSTCIVTARAYRPGMLASAPVEVTIYWANQSWYCNPGIGWRFVAFPFKLTQTMIDNIFWIWGDLYLYDTTQKLYSKATTIEPGRTYWVHLKENLPMTLKGASVTQGNVVFPTRKWTAYGAMQDGPVPQGIAAWQFNGIRFEPAETFQKGRGYFIYKP